MATEIGFIKGLIGSAIATAADGSQRTLQVGDKLFVNEIVSTGAAGAVEIEFIDGSIMDLGRNSQAILDDEVIDPQQATQAQTQMQDDVEALQQALLDGADPTQVGEATAAGAGAQAAGNEGHTSVTVEYLAPEADVTSGFETTGPSLVLPEIINEIYEEDLKDQPNDPPVITDGSPVALDNGLPGALAASNTVFEDRADFNSPAGTGLGFINGRGDFTPQTTTGDILANDSFGTDGPGGLVSVTYTGTSAGVTSLLLGGVTTLQMTDPDSPGTGPIWTLTVKPNGEYTFTLHKPYVHSGQGEDIAQELFQYTIQDADGDTASATLTFNIVDDVPHIDNDSQQIPTAFVDEDDVLASGNADSFVSLPINFGADGSAATNAVSLSTAGIVDQNGNHLTLNGVALAYTWDANTGVLTGMAGDVPVLIMTVEHDAIADSYGVRVNLLSNLDHPDITTEDNLVIKIAYTVTDFDGDSVDGVFAVDIDDDSPSITATQPTAPAYQFTITNHDEVSSAGYHNSYGYYIKDAVTGEPTTGVIVWDDVHDKDTVPVTVTGYTPDQIGFFIIPNGDNKNAGLEDNTPVTFSFVKGQWQAFSGTTPLVGNGAHVFFDNSSLNKDSQTHLVDNRLIGNQNWEDLLIPQGDSDFNDVNINVEWSVVNSRPLTVDETALADGDDATMASTTMALAGSFAINPGADGLGSVEYKLGLVSENKASGIVDTSSGEPVLLRTNAGHIEGYVAGGVVFTLTVDMATGEVTLTQLRAVVHGNPVDHDESATPATISNGLIAMTATVTDGDGDSASDSIDVGALIAFEDDGPIAVADNVITTEDTAVIIDVLANDSVGADNATISSYTQTTNGTVVLNDNGTFTYTPSANYSGSDSFRYTLKDGDNDTATATVSIGVRPVADVPTLIMSMGEPTNIILGDENLIINGSFEDLGHVNTDGVPILGELTGTSLVSVASIPGWTTIAGANMEPHAKGHAGVGSTDGNHYMDLGASPGNSSIEQTFDSLVSGQTYQLSFDFRDKAAMQERGQAGQDSGIMNILWNGVAIATVQGNNTAGWESLTINVTATGNDSLVFAEIGVSDDNWGMALDNLQLHGVTYSYELSMFDALTDLDGSESLSGVTISNIPDGANIASAANADGTYNPGTLTITSNHILSAIEINTITGQVTSTDGTNTATTTETARVVFDGLDATGETADLLIKGDSGTNNIIGGAGDDIIFGGGGNDSLTGGAGSDIFIWNHGDIGSATSPAHDTVTDFDVAHDKLNLADLLSDPSVTHTIEGIATGADNHLQLNIKNTAGSTVQEIELQGVDATHFGTDANATLQSLLATGVINDGI